MLIQVYLGTFLATRSRATLEEPVDEVELQRFQQGRYRLGSGGSGREGGLRGGGGGNGGGEAVGGGPFGAIIGFLISIGSACSGCCVRAEDGDEGYLHPTSGAHPNWSNGTRCCFRWCLQLVRLGVFDRACGRSTSSSVSLSWYRCQSLQDRLCMQEESKVLATYWC